MEGRLAEALDLQTEARQIALRAVQLRPGNHTRRQAAFKLLSRCETLRAMQQYPEAERSAREAEAELRAIASADPADDQARADLSLAELRLGEVAASGRRIQDARTHLGEALRLRREQYTKHPSSPQAIRSYQAVLVRYANLLLSTGGWMEAAPQFEEAVAHGGILRQLTPSDVYAAADLARAYAGAAKCARRRAQPDALALLRQSIDLWREIRQRCPLDAELKAAAEQTKQILSSWSTRS
jgi:tetratricopeptide (TPR) repeat protein